LDSLEPFCVSVLRSWVIWPIYGLKNWLWYSKTSNIWRYKIFPFSSPSLSKILVAPLVTAGFLVRLIVVMCGLYCLDSFTEVSSQLWGCDEVLMMTSLSC